MRTVWGFTDSERPDDIARSENGQDQFAPVGLFDDNLDQSRLHHVCRIGKLVGHQHPGTRRQGMSAHQSIQHGKLRQAQAAKQGDPA